MCLAVKAAWGKQHGEPFIDEAEENRWHPLDMFLLSLDNGSVEKHGGRDSYIMASFPASTCRGGRKYLQGRSQVLAGKVACISVEDAVHCKDGCSALQERLQCTASETGKRDSEITSPILDER